MSEAAKERPILFSAPMVRALLAGTKTQTRRIVKPQPESNINPVWIEDAGAFQWHSIGSRRRCPYGQPGDALYVREALMAVKDTTISPEEIMPVCAYRADGAHIWERDQVRVPWQWQCSTLPAIHCPRWASRITLRVISVRVERLQEVSEEDAEAEGLAASANYSARQHFARLWTEINGAGSWDANPWCWCLSFSREPAP